MENLLLALLRAEMVDGAPTSCTSGSPGALGRARREAPTRHGRRNSQWGEFEALSFDEQGVQDKLEFELGESATSETTEQDQMMEQELEARRRGARANTYDPDLASREPGRPLLKPTLAKLMDVFGRFEVLVVSVVFYLIGTIVESSSANVKAFAGGAILYQIGYTAVQLIAEFLVADLTTLRNRVLFSFIPAAPFLINAWISGNVTDAVLGATTWQWGIGMWAIIYFVCSLPFLFSLWYGGYQARKSGALDSYNTPFERLGARDLAIALFWQLDVIGIVLVIAVFALILVPFTIAGSAKDQWKDGGIIAMLVIGFCCIPVLLLWELKAKHPLIPFRLMKDHGVWAAMCIAMLLNASWYLQGEYLYTVLVVAFNETIESATRITNVYSFTSVVTGVTLGFVVRYVRYLKLFIVFGVCLFMVAFGLLIRFRGGESSHAAVVGAQVVLGVAGGLFAYPHSGQCPGCDQARALGRDHCPLPRAVLPGELSSRLGNATLAAEVYASPLTTAILYEMESFEREAPHAGADAVEEIAPRGPSPRSGAHEQTTLDIILPKGRALELYCRGNNAICVAGYRSKDDCVVFPIDPTDEGDKRPTQAVPAAHPAQDTAAYKLGPGGKRQQDKPEGAVKTGKSNKKNKKKKVPEGPAVTVYCNKKGEKPFLDIGQKLVATYVAKVEIGDSGSVTEFTDEISYGDSTGLSGLNLFLREYLIGIGKGGFKKITIPAACTAQLSDCSLGRIPKNTAVTMRVSVISVVQTERT
ncbi:hypothetical protein K523DRAFT_421581 [Schizophyllum commune Tattone D]|nr:hypothetical protein K523DRAFT_421581 [Schizophyllum commune Tattone D]